MSPSCHISIKHWVCDIYPFQIIAAMCSERTCFRYFPIWWRWSCLRTEHGAGTIHWICCHCCQCWKRRKYLYHSKDCGSGISIKFGSKMYFPLMFSDDLKTWDISLRWKRLKILSVTICTAGNWWIGLLSRENERISADPFYLLIWTCVLFPFIQGCILAVHLKIAF